MENKILIVDDEEPIRIALKQVLEDRDYVCSLAESAARARECMTRENFALVLCDVKMPGESGLAFVQYVLDEHPETAAVMVSVATDQGIVRSALDMGVYGYIVKPFTANEVLINVANALRRQKLECENRAHRENLERMVHERTGELLKTVDQLEQAKEALRESEEIYRSLVERAGDGVAIIQDSLMKYANPRLGEMVGCITQEVIGTPFTGHVHPDELPKVVDRYERRMAGEEVRSTYETALKRRDGSRLEVEINAGVVNYMGRPSDLVLMRDVTERKRAEEAVRESESKFRTLTEMASAAIFIYRGDCILYASPGAVAITGYGEAELLNMNLWDLIRPDWQQIAKARGAARQRSEEVPTRYELPILTKDGQERWLDFTAALIEYQGEPALLGTAFDITERKRAEEAVRESELKYRTLLENLPQRIFFKDRASTYVVCNGEYARDLKISPEGIAGRTDFDFHPKELAEKYRADDRRIMDSGQTEELDETYLDNGQERVVHTVKTPVRDTGGNVVGILGVFGDVTERKRAEEELGRVSRQRELILESAGEAILGLDFEGRVTFANQAASKILGWEVEELVDQQLHGLIHHSKRDGSPYPAEECVICEGVNMGAECCRPVDEVFWAKDGRQLQVEGVLTSIVEQQTIAGGVLTFEDVTDRKVLESQLVQAQKLESIGQLAAGISHEINTPTQYVGDNARFLKDAFGDLGQLLEKYGELSEALKAGAETKGLVQEVEAVVEGVDVKYLTDEIPKALEQTLEGVERVSKIVRAMKDFSHPDVEEKTPLDINRAIESTMTVARNEWKYVADLETDFDQSSPLVPCIPGEFNQVILNMVINAAHAIAGVVGNGSGGKGKITASTRCDGEWAEIRISDTGTGIPEKIRSRVFDPFFTTKEVGKGTGQGLAISRSVIVDKHGGSLSFETEVGRGTTFIIRLPVCAKPSETETRHEKANSVRR